MKHDRIKLDSQFPIDFVITWVDGSDEEWLSEKARYDDENLSYGKADNRFRDWDLLRYFFRGVESYAPWVRTVYFVTWGHIPSWLDTSHPKLRIVNHREYIPEEYLPTFNSNTIELNFHRIEGLAEHFVLFNDDCFLLKPCSPSVFFKNGLPRDFMISDVIKPFGRKYGISYTMVNNLNILNEHFDKRSVMLKNLSKAFSWRYGMRNVRTILLLPWHKFTGFVNPHLPTPHLKSTFERVWQLENESLDMTCRSRFRGKDDVNHWIMRYWNLCEGKFSPQSNTYGRYFNITNDNAKMYSYITNQIGYTICLNDFDYDIAFTSLRHNLANALDSVLPSKSAFEKS